MAPLHIRISSNGYTALYGDELESLVKAHLPDWSTTASHPLHITLLTKDEARSLDSNPFTDAGPPKDLVVVGLGGDRAQGALHLVVLANSLQVVRKKAGLPLKEFHITLSTPPRSSPEDWPHGLATLFADPRAEPHPPVKLLDALSLDYFLRSDFSAAYEIALRCTSSLHPPSAQSHIRLGDAALKLEQHKLAMLAYARAWELAEDDKVRQYALKGIGKCSLYTEWGTSFEERERGDLEGLPTARGKGKVTDGDHQALWTPWSTELRSEVAQMAEEMDKPELCLESREKVFLLDDAREEVRLMRFFVSGLSQGLEQQMLTPLAYSAGSFRSVSPSPQFLVTKVTSPLLPRLLSPFVTSLHFPSKTLCLPPGSTCTPQFATLSSPSKTSVLLLSSRSKSSSDLPLKHARQARRC